MCWIAGGAIIAGGIGAIGANSAADTQAGAAAAAAQAQKDAAAEQAQLNAGEFNVAQGETQAGRTLGGEAQNRLAYLLGLDPNLDISGSTATYNLKPDINNPNDDPLTVSGKTQPTVYNGGVATPGGTTQQTAPAPNGIDPSSGYRIGPGGGITQRIPSPVGGGSPEWSSTGNGGGHMTIPERAPGAVPTTGGPATIGSNSTLPGTAAGGPAFSSAPGGFGSLASPYNPSTFQQDPGYQFALDQGEQALKRAQAASGLTGSGAAAKDLATYTVGQASQEFNNAFNRSLASQTQQENMLTAAITGGQVSTGQALTSGGQAVGGVNSAIAGYGNAGAAGAIGAGAASAGGTYGVTNSLGYGASQLGQALSKYNSTPAESSSSGQMTGLWTDPNSGYTYNVPSND